ncbi:MAG: hypothetical protein CMP24_02205 [Rickettsiales bacterium]|nr:hypothetical protein [Rickettsiales bacterium]
MKKILIIKHGALGDIILSLYAIHSIKNHFKISEITVLTEEKYADIFLNLKSIDKIIVDNRPKIFLSYQFIKLFVWFHKSNFDWIFDLQTSFRTKIYFKIFSIFKKFNWNGIEKKCSHPHLDANRKRLHTKERHKKQLEKAGIKSIEKIDWSFLDTDINNFKLPYQYVILVPGGSFKRPEKRWKIKNFIEIIQYLSKKNLFSVLVGGEDELEKFKSINFKNFNCYNLVGKTNFVQLAALSRRASLILGNDTGPMHLLSECSKKSIKKIVLFGSGSDPKLCAPVAENVMILKRKSINDISPNEIKNIILKNI